MSEDIYMIRDDMSEVGPLPFPDGFSMRLMRPGDESEWTKVWQDVEPPGKIDGSIFAREFGADWNLIEARCLLLIAPSGEVAGTVGAWFNDTFMGCRFGCIHWLAIKRNFQGKGLSMPMLMSALKRLVRLGHDRCYLITQTCRLPAIRLYLKCGFKPLIREETDLAKWKSVQGLPCIFD